jgi:hypothetical protein
MGKIVKISAKNNLTTVRKALKDLHLTMAAENARNKKPKTLADFYGSLPDTFGDGLTYQKKIRDEW